MVKGALPGDGLKTRSVVDVYLGRVGRDDEGEAGWI